MSRAALVIGVGNPLRGDDAAGIEAARRVRAAGIGPVEVVEHNADGTGLMEAWRGREAVIVIDAASSGAAPGTVVRFDPANEPVPAEFFRYSTHAFGVAEAVELARGLGELPPRLIVYGIEGADFRAGAPLTPAVADAIRQVAERVAADVRGLAGG